MAKEISTDIVINARPEKIWQILTDFDKYPNWNPFIKSINGDVKLGNQITVVIAPPNTKGMTFKPHIRVFNIHKELRWLGRFIMPGLFDGEHAFQLIDNGNATTTFKHSEKFSGLLVGLINLDNTKLGFEAMNKQLKILAEQ